jgi:pimeloyl-ACP methyl ester carboxylesterase
VQVAEGLGPGRYVLLDFPGHGTASGTPPATFDSLVDGTIAYLDRLPRHPVLIGHSMGGMVAIAAVARRPDLVSGLILAEAFPFLPAVVDVLGDAEDEDDPFGYGSVIDRRTPPGVQARVRAGMAAGVRTAGASLHTELMDLDLRPALESIDVPTLALIGDRQSITPKDLDAVRDALGLRTAGGLVVRTVPSHHFIMLEQPQLVAHYTEKFFLDQEIAVKGKK